MKTIKDIAEEANVSAGTVDRVIHNRPGVSPKTKSKIEKLLKKHSFERNVLASALASKKKYSIATLLPDSKSRKDFWYEPDKGIKTTAKEIEQYGFETHCFYFDKFNLKSYTDAFDDILRLSPNGVVLAPFFYKTSIDFAKELDARGIPFIFINIDIPSLQNIAFIGQDSFKSGFLCGKLFHLLLKSNDHIAILRSHKNVDNHRAIAVRIEGFLDYFKQNSVPRSIESIYFETFEMAEVKNVLSEELKKDTRIKGFFVPSSNIFAVAGFLENSAIKDIRLVGFDPHIENWKHLKNGTIDFLIDQNPFEQGYMGLKILFEYLLLSKKPEKVYSSPINIVTLENADYYRKAKVADLVV